MMYFFDLIDSSDYSNRILFHLEVADSLGPAVGLFIIN
jgi:hypothetical protein